MKQQVILNPFEKLDIFISYSEIDEQHASMLFYQLKNQGFRVYAFKDTPNMPGTNFWEAIQNHILFAHAVIVIWGYNSFHSTWIQKEIKYATELKKFIIPIILDPRLPVMEEIKMTQAILAYKNIYGWVYQVYPVLNWLIHNRQALLLASPQERSSLLEKTAKGVGGIVGVGLLAGLLGLLGNDED